MTMGNDANFYRDLEREYPLIDRAKGIYLYDERGNEYLDFGSGISVTSIGCGVEQVIEEMSRQLQKATFIYNGYFTNWPRIKMSQKLLGFCPEGMSKVIFASSGSEANEVAIKIARQYHCERGNDSKYKVVSRRRSYHGNTLGSLSVSGRTLWREHFLPYLCDFPQISAPYCYRCPFCLEYPECALHCAHELEEAIISQGPQNVSAFIAEPIIGTTVTAVRPPGEYYRIIRSICDKYDVLFIADEVITGIGRTGSNFAMDHWGVTPDITTTAKGLAAGYAPLSAVIVHDRVFEAFANGSRRHSQGFTYSSNPLSCTAGLAVLDYIEANNLVAASRERGRYLLEKLREELGAIDIVGDIRGTGLLVGVEFVSDYQSRRPFPVEARLTERIVTSAFGMGLIVIAGFPGCADGQRGDHIQLTPALVISEAQIDKAVGILRKAIEQSIP